MALDVSEILCDSSELKKGEKERESRGVWLWHVLSLAFIPPQQERQSGGRAVNWCVPSRSPVSPRTSGTTRTAASTGRRISPNSQVGRDAGGAAQIPARAGPSVSNSGRACPLPATPPKPGEAARSSFRQGGNDEFLISIWSPSA